ncbi:MAG: glycosyltransferase [Candidatus Binataceae bacterium]
MKVSVVINTYNRADSLRDTIESLRYLDGPEFEVIVVNGPSTDHTESVLESYSSGIRVGTCEARNLSVSRNVGIEMARGDVVAFLDDDAVADRFWLRDLGAGYDASDIAGVGGRVFDYTGFRLQYGYAHVDRFGNARYDALTPLTDFAFPGASQIPYLQGTNASFRRDLLLEIDGFDEEFEYYHDETDVCLRLVDAGYRLRQVPNAFIYHRFLPSDVRNAEKVVTKWYSIIKNKIYFSLKNSEGKVNVQSAIRDAELFADQCELDLRRFVEARGLDPELIEEFKVDADTAFRHGLERGLSRYRRLKSSPIAVDLRGRIACDVYGWAPSQFQRFPVLRPQDGRLTVCLLSQQYPPGVTGGIGRFSHDLACGLAEEGHEVHVLARSNNPHNTVDFEQGVWVHRLVPDDSTPPLPEGVRVPIELWQHSARAFREILRIDELHPVDIVEAPVWDAEGLATVLDGRFTTVTSLETPLKVALKTNPSWIDGSREQAKRLADIEAAEGIAVNRADGVRAISQAVWETMREEYRLHLEPNRVRVIPLGIRDVADKAAPRMDQMVEVLFVGRFEHRKGIDVLLKAIPKLCNRFPKVRFLLVGADLESQQGGIGYKERFESANRHGAFLDRVHFLGEVADVSDYYSRCDVFVAPSRYESFGLIYLEAMRFAKPVIGCRAGGIPEVVGHGVTGYLAEPGDPYTLSKWLEVLIRDKEARLALGRAGRRRFETAFLRRSMVERTIDFYRSLLRNRATYDSRQPS